MISAPNISFISWDHKAQPNADELTEMIKGMPASNILVHAGNVVCDDYMMISCPKFAEDWVIDNHMILYDADENVHFVWDDKRVWEIRDHSREGEIDEDPSS